jgi:hypothetical protein
MTRSIRRRITQREGRISFNLQAPLDMEPLEVRAKRKVDPNAPKEWHLQRDCIAATRALARVNKSLRYMAPGATQTNLTPAQRGFATLMGWQRGLADIWLMRCMTDPAPSVLGNNWLKMHIIELKLPHGTLSDEQGEWFAWLRAAGVKCSRVDNLADYLTILHGFVK